MFGIFKRKRKASAPSERLAEGGVNPWAEIDAHYGDLSRVSMTSAMAYVPFARAISLIASKMAKIIVNTAYVQDESKRIVSTAHTKKALRLLRQTPDGSGVISAQQFVKMLAQDYLVGGNALAFAPRGMAAGTGSTYRPPVKLLRLDPYGAVVNRVDMDSGYEALRYDAKIYGMGHRKENFSALDVAHSRYYEPFDDGSYGIGASRQWFGLAPLYMLAKALRIGGNSDDWVINFYDEGAKSNLHIGFPEDLDADTQRDVLKNVAASTRNKRQPIVTYGGAVVQELRPTPESADSRGMREYQVTEIARFYGISPPSIGINVTQWGSGIDNLTRLDYRRCFEQHIDALLDPLSFRMLPHGQRFAVSALEETRGDTKSIVEFANAFKPSPNGPALASKAELRWYAGLVGDYEDDYEEHEKGISNDPEPGTNDDDSDDNDESDEDAAARFRHLTGGQ